MSKIIRETCAAIWDVLAPIYLKCPTNVHEWRNIADDYEKIWDFPNCLGSIDGKHIRIERPKKKQVHFTITTKDFIAQFFLRCVTQNIVSQ